MFSGIIEHQARILKIEHWVFRVENTFGKGLDEWQSIAHDGACMTLTTITPEYYEFFTMQESLRITNFSMKQVGDTFNVERSLSMSDRIDGHFVTGHIDTIWTVNYLEAQTDGSLVYGIGFDTKFSNLIIKKGSIAINGVSLTVADISDQYFTVSLIPLTQSWTNLGKSKSWDTVNLEFDMIGKYVNKNLESRS